MYRYFIATILLSLFTTLLIAHLLGGWTAKYTSEPYSFDDIPNMKGKNVLITGATGGIGFIAARELAKKGAHVIATGRNPQKGSLAVNQIKKVVLESRSLGSIEFKELDLASFRSIKRFVREYLTSQPSFTLDVLILNAGVMMTPFSLTEDGLELQIGTNHFGHFYLVKLLERFLLQSKARVVTISGSIHVVTYSGGIRWDTFNTSHSYDPLLAYGQSKLANLLFAKKLARRWNDTGAISVVVHPGAIATDLTRSLSSKTHRHNPLMQTLQYALALSKFVMMPVEMGALTPLKAATDPSVYSMNGAYYEPIGKLCHPSSHALNESLQDILWMESEKIIENLAGNNN